MSIKTTLGKAGGKKVGIFDHKRKADGVHIDLTVGNAKSIPIKKFCVTNNEWTSILSNLENQGTMSLTQGKTSPVASNLADTIRSAVPNPNWGSWHDSQIAAVASVLMEEGSIEHHHGVSGKGNAISIIVKPA